MSLLLLLLLKSPEATEDRSQHRRCRRRLLNQLGHLRSELVPSPQLRERVAPQPKMLSALLPRAAQSALRGLLSPHHGQPSSQGWVVARAESGEINSLSPGEGLLLPLPDSAPVHLHQTRVPDLLSSLLMRARRVAPSNGTSSCPMSPPSPASLSASS